MQLFVCKPATGRSKTPRLGLSYSSPSASLIPNWRAAKLPEPGQNCTSLASKASRKIPGSICVADPYETSQPYSASPCMSWARALPSGDFRAGSGAPSALFQIFGVPNRLHMWPLGVGSTRYVELKMTVAVLRKASDVFTATAALAGLQRASEGFGGRQSCQSPCPLRVKELLQSQTQLRLSLEIDACGMQQIS